MTRLGDPDGRPVVVGEAPSKTGDRYWRFPLSGDPAVKLCRWAGWEVPKGDHAWWTLIEHVEPVNLLERYPGPLGRGAALPRHLAEPAWASLLPELRGRVVVVLGVRLGALAGLSAHHAWVEHDGGFVVSMVPHTSGLSHVYNDPGARERTGVTLRAAREMAMAP